MLRRQISMLQVVMPTMSNVRPSIARPKMMTGKRSLLCLYCYQHLSKQVYRNTFQRTIDNTVLLCRVWYRERRFSVAQATRDLCHTLIIFYDNNQNKIYLKYQNEIPTVTVSLYSMFMAPHVRTLRAHVKYSQFTVRTKGPKILFKYF